MGKERVVKPRSMSNLARQPSDPLISRLNRRVLIVTDDASGSVDMIEHLRDLSLKVTIIGYDGSRLSELPDQSPSVALCFLSDYVEHSPAIIADIRQHYAPRDFPIMGRLMRKTLGGHPYDSVLYAPVHPVQVAHRVSSLIRLGQMENEIIRRMETLKKTFGQDKGFSENTLRQPFRVLFIGKADPAYMAVMNALQDKNMDVVAAFTSFSAFDYLHNSTFDAVVINALKGIEPALTIAETMRRNPRLYHVPTLLLVDKPNFKDEDLAYTHDLKDLISADAPPEELSGRILELANECRLHLKLKDEFSNLGGSACSDPETGVLNTRFLAAHLKRVSRDCRARKVPLTILTLKLVPLAHSAVDEPDLNAAFASSIRLIAGIVRMQDIVARIDTDIVIVAFPEECRSDVEQISQRISELIENASFHMSNQDRGALSMSVEAGIVEQDENSGENIAPEPSGHAETISLVR